MYGFHQDGYPRNPGEIIHASFTDAHDYDSRMIQAVGSPNPLAALFLKKKTQPGDTIVVKNPFP